MALLEVDHLQTHFGTPDGVVRAVEGVSFHINAGETLGIVGESGCGKSVTAMSILRLIPEPPGKIAGAIRFEGRDLLEATRRRDAGHPRQRDLDDLPGADDQPESGADGRQADRRDAAAAPGPVSARRREEGDRDADPGRHSRTRSDGSASIRTSLSGGMRQRVMIAMALACNPKLLIADEPTTALDVTIQAQILDLMRDLKTRLGSAIMLITHDLGVVAEMAERVVVMYAGRKVEEAAVGEIFARPLHPYTRGLLGAVPKLGSSLHDGGRGKLAEIAGLVPSLRQPIVGCAVCRALPDGDGSVPPGRAGDRDRRRPATWWRATTPNARMAA